MTSSSSAAIAEGAGGWMEGGSEEVIWAGNKQTNASVLMSNVGYKEVFERKRIIRARID